jgi:hypothetical protein
VRCSHPPHVIAYLEPISIGYNTDNTTQVLPVRISLGTRRSEGCASRY